ncbi:penicillin-binding protein 1A [Xanthobacter sp. KR7-225]|uniref:transglycosylase domain-containing protein n=1 Tax=Xanthobacter sp. KR7-225 TaxID=3156613 RepID=UPI0032B42D55
MRREPVLGHAGGEPGGLDIRLDPRDRPAPAPVKPKRSSERPPERIAQVEPRGPKRATKEERPKQERPKQERLRPAERRAERGPGRGAGRRRTPLLWRAVKWGALLGLWALIAVAGVVAYEASKLPPMHTLMVPKRPPTVTILSADGKTLATRGDMGGVAVPIRQLPPFLPKAFVAIEDQRFYSHFGLDPEGLARALVTNITSRRLRQGGSTLTQQLAKNLFLTQERTASRKIQELVLALWLEAKFSKDEILDLYLNRVYFGAGAYGVEAAAQRYFAKSARQVTLAEAAMLAGLVNSPSRLAPTRNLKGAQARAALVLAAMRDQGMITKDMAQAALARPAQLARPSAPGSSGYVADYVMEQLESFAGDVTGDVTVRTTIEPALQQAAERALEEALAKSGGKYGVGQGALVGLDTDGAVKALVGGRSYEDSQFNRAVTAKRQPGSAFKPFIYLAALERGLTPDTVRDDAPIQLKGWRPENASHEYRGPVTLETALALSLNTVSVRLALEVGPKAVVDTAHRLGITSTLAPNASIALGTSEVSVLELAGAYVPFANGGIGVIPHVIDEVRGADGKVLYRRNTSGPGRVLDPAYAAMMNRMLIQTLATGTARRADLPGWEAAGKTGTSQDYRDAWFVGYTARYVTAVWLGNDDSSPTKKASGANIPVEIWSRYMKTAHQNVPVAELPGGLRSAGFGGIGYGQPGGSFLPPDGVPDDRPPAVVGQMPQRPAPQEPMTLDRWFVETFLGGGRR